MGLIGRLARIFSGLRTKSTDSPRGSVIAFIMALITVLATGVAGLQQYSSQRDDSANREAELIANAAIGSDVAAVVEANGDYGIMRRWQEELFQQTWAQQQLSADPLGPASPLLQTMANSNGELATWASTQSGLLQAPYYDAQNRTTDAVAYGAERSASTFRAREERLAAAEESNAWSTVSTRYVAILTMLAVALFFLGIASTARGAARPGLTLAGSVLGLLAFAWTITSVASGVSRTQQSAVDRLVDGNVALMKGTGYASTDVEKARPFLEAAARAADAALEQDGDYDSPLLLRAGARLTLANAILSKGEDTDETRTLINGALEDYRSYASLRPEDPATWWNLGITAFFAGQYEESVEASTKSIEISPNQFPVYMNRAIAYLALKNQAAADADVETGLRVATESGLDSNASFFIREDAGLERLAARRPDEADAIIAMQRRLREVYVAYRATGEDAPDASAPEVAVDSAALIGVTLNGEIMAGKAISDGDTFGQAEGGGVRLTLVGQMDRDRTVSVRVWNADQLDPTFDVDRRWDEGEESITVDLLSPYGRAGFAMNSGKYYAEVFLDGATRARFEFEVAAPTA